LVVLWRAGAANVVLQHWLPGIVRDDALCANRRLTQVCALSLLIGMVESCAFSWHDVHLAQRAIDVRAASPYMRHVLLFGGDAEWTLEMWRSMVLRNVHPCDGADYVAARTYETLCTAHIDRLPHGGVALFSVSRTAIDDAAVLRALDVGVLRTRMRRTARLFAQLPPSRASL